MQTGLAYKSHAERCSLGLRISSFRVWGSFNGNFKNVEGDDEAHRHLLAGFFAFVVSSRPETAFF
jgi:hypothetical protein